MSNDNAPRQGAEGEAYPPWFTTYLESLSIKREEIQVEALENVLNECEDISQVLKSNISAAYRSEAQLEAARQTDRAALNQQLLCTPVSYTCPISLESDRRRTGKDLFQDQRFVNPSRFCIQIPQTLVSAF